MVEHWLNWRMKERKNKQFCEKRRWKCLENILVFAFFDFFNQKFEKMKDLIRFWKIGIGFLNIAIKFQKKFCFFFCVEISICCLNNQKNPSFIRLGNWIINIWKESLKLERKFEGNWFFLWWFDDLWFFWLILMNLIVNGRLFFDLIQFEENKLCFC